MISFENTDASSFLDNAKYYYDRELLNILEKIALCYTRIVENYELVLNNEDAIRDYIHCNYLNNIDIRNELNFSYHFECEPKEYGVNDGYLDIKVFNENIFANPSEYYIIECKRLDSTNPKGTAGLNSKYINDGILRFIDKKYSCYHRVNGMIGFIVQQVNIDENVNCINDVLRDQYPNANTTKFLTKNNSIESYDYLYDSEHTDIDSNQLVLYHLMLDFSSNIETVN